MIRVKHMLLGVGCLLLTLTVSAQALTCPALVERALVAADSLCAETARNQACYGNTALTAEVREGVSEFQFNEPGDIVNLTDVNTLTLTAMDVESENWGIALLQVQANLPDTLPGQNVTLLLFGDLEVNNRGGSADETGSYGEMQAFYFRSGIGDAPCAEAPESGILIQTPGEAGQVLLNINEATVRLGSTAFLQAVPGDSMTIAVLEGQGQVTADGASVDVPEGTQISVPLDDDGLADGVPGYPQPYDQQQADALPANTLPESVEAAAPVSAETAPLLFTVPSASLNTDPTQRVSYPRPEGDFIAETQLSFSPDANFQGAGLYAEFDTGGRIEFLLAYCEQGATDCVQRGLYFDVFTSPGFSERLAHAVLPYSGTTVQLQLENAGGRYIARYRGTSGDAWTEFANFTASPVVTEVGILAQSASGVTDNPMGAPSITAEFENFTIRRP